MKHHKGGVIRMTMAGWVKRYINGGTPYSFALIPRPSAGSNVFTFQRPQRDPVYQVQGPATMVAFHGRIYQPQKWSIQTVLLAGIPATTGTFNLSDMVNIDFAPFESMPYSGE
jgi:hypothetical protein